MVRWPLPFQIAACACSTRKLYLESVYALFPFPISKAQVRAMSSVNWAKITGGKGLASMVSKLETIAFSALLFQSKTKLLPSA